MLPVCGIHSRPLCSAFLYATCSKLERVVYYPPWTKGGQPPCYSENPASDYPSSSFFGAALASGHIQPAGAHPAGHIHSGHSQRAPPPASQVTALRPLRVRTFPHRYAQNTTTHEAIIGVAGDTVREPQWCIQRTYMQVICRLLHLPCTRPPFMHNHTSTIPQLAWRRAPLVRPHRPFS